MSSFRMRISVAILTAVGGGLILAACGNSENAATPAPVAPTTSAHTTSAPSTNTPPAAPVVEQPAPADQPKGPGKAAPAKTLGPNGYGKLRFGMTEKQARASGEVVADHEGQRTGDAPGCAGYDLINYPTPQDNWSVAISQKFGVVAIFAQPGMRTPEGIGMGASFAKVKTAYPSIEKGTHGHYATIPGHDSVQYRFSFDEKNVLAHFFVERRDQDCYE